MGDSEEKADISDGELQNLLEDRLNVCNNMAAAQIKLGVCNVLSFVIKKNYKTSFLSRFIRSGAKFFGDRIALSTT